MSRGNEARGSPRVRATRASKARKMRRKMRLEDVIDRKKKSQFPLFSGMTVILTLPITFSCSAFRYSQSFLVVMGKSLTSNIKNSHCILSLENALAIAPSKACSLPFLCALVKTASD